MHDRVVLLKSSSRETLTTHDDTEVTLELQRPAGCPQINERIYIRNYAVSI